MRFLTPMKMAVAMVMLTACHATKPAVDVVNTTDLSAPTVQQVAQNTRHWQSMQCGGQVKLGGSMSFSSSMQLRMVRGQSISVSLRPMLGIEVARMLVTRDSVLVVDKVHKRYIAEPLALLAGGLPVTVSDMQDIFLGRPFVLGAGSIDTTRTALAQVALRESGFDLVPVEQPRSFSYRFGYDSAGRILSLDVLPAKGNGDVYSVRYADVRSTTAGNVAHNVDIATAVRGRDLSLGLTLDDITWNGAFRIDTAIPPGYKRVAYSSLGSMLGM